MALNSISQGNKMAAGYEELGDREISVKSDGNLKVGDKLSLTGRLGRFLVQWLPGRYQAAVDHNQQVMNALRKDFSAICKNESKVLLQADTLLKASFGRGQLITARQVAKIAREITIATQDTFNIDNYETMAAMITPVGPHGQERTPMETMLADQAAKLGLTMPRAVYAEAEEEVRMTIYKADHRYSREEMTDLAQGAIDRAMRNELRETIATYLSRTLLAGAPETVVADGPGQPGKLSRDMIEGLVDRLMKKRGDLTGPVDTLNIFSTKELRQCFGAVPSPSYWVGHEDSVFETKLTPDKEKKLGEDILGRLKAGSASPFQRVVNEAAATLSTVTLTNMTPAQQKFRAIMAPLVQGNLAAFDAATVDRITTSADSLLGPIKNSLSDLKRPDKMGPGQLNTFLGNLAATLKNQPGFSLLSAEHRQFTLKMAFQTALDEAGMPYQERQRMAVELFRTGGPVMELGFTLQEGLTQDPDGQLKAGLLKGLLQNVDSFNSSFASFSKFCLGYLSPKQIDRLGSFDNVSQAHLTKLELDVLKMNLQFQWEQYRLPSDAMANKERGSGLRVVGLEPARLAALPPGEDKKRLEPLHDLAMSMSARFFADFKRQSYAVGTAGSEDLEFLGQDLNSPPGRPEGDFERFTQIFDRQTALNTAPLWGQNIMADLQQFVMDAYEKENGRLVVNGQQAGNNIFHPSDLQDRLQKIRSSQGPCNFLVEKMPDDRLHIQIHYNEQYELKPGEAPLDDQPVLGYVMAADLYLSGVSGQNPSLDDVRCDLRFIR